MKPNCHTIPQEQLNKLIKEGVHMGVMTDKQADYILMRYLSIPVFHSFPKIHKPGFLPSFLLCLVPLLLNKNACGWVDSLL